MPPPLYKQAKLPDNWIFVHCIVLDAFFIGARRQWSMFVFSTDLLGEIERNDGGMILWECGWLLVEGI